MWLPLDWIGELLRITDGNLAERRVFGELLSENEPFER